MTSKIIDIYNNNNNRLVDELINLSLYIKKTFENRVRTREYMKNIDF